MALRVLDAPISLVERSRKPADEMSIIVEDLIRLLDSIGGGLKRGKHPESAQGSKIASLLRKLADELDG
jgi:CspA family cold shock protein